MNFLIVAAVMLLSSVLQTMTGMPGGTFAVMLLPPIIGSIIEAGALNTLCTTGCTISLFLKYRKDALYKEAILPVIGYFISLPIFSKLALGTLEAYLRPMLGLMLIGLCVYFLWYEGKVKIRVSKVNGCVAGILSGAFSGLFSIGSVPLVIYFVNALKDKNQYMGTLQLCFVFTCLYSSAIRIALGIITWHTMSFAIPSLIGIMGGLYAGNWALKYLPVEFVKKMTFLVIGISGLCMALEPFLG